MIKRRTERTGDNTDRLSVRIGLVKVVGSHLIAHAAINAAGAEIEKPVVIDPSSGDFTNGAPCMTRLVPGSQPSVGNTTRLPINRSNPHLFAAAPDRPFRGSQDR